MGGGGEANVFTRKEASGPVLDLIKLSEFFREGKISRRRTNKRDLFSVTL